LYVDFNYTYISTQLSNLYYTQSFWSQVWTVFIEKLSTIESNRSVSPSHISKCHYGFNLVSHFCDKR